MEYRRLGDSGLLVSEVGLGTNTFGRRLDEDGTRRVVDRAIDLGITFIDTADVYGDGDSERFIGRALGTRRHQVVLATKFGSASGPTPHQRGGSRHWVIESVEASLRRLNTDYIDLYQTHRPDPTTPFEESMRALDDLVTSGKVRYIGCSNLAAWEVCQAMWVADKRSYVPFVSSQSRYNVLDRTIERELIPCCRSLGIGIIAFSPLNEGTLTGKYKVDEPPPPDSRHARNPGLSVKQFSPELRRRAQALSELAAEYGRPPVHLALAWLLNHPEVSTVIAGSTKLEQLDQNVQAVGWTLSKDDIRRIEAAANPQPVDANGVALPVR